MHYSPSSQSDMAPSEQLPSPQPSLVAIAKVDTSKQQLYETFGAAALQLLLYHGVKPSELSSTVTAALKDASAALPQLAVLHSSSYGGYGPSSKFASFIKASRRLAPPTSSQWSHEEEANEVDGAGAAHGTEEEESVPALVPSLALMCVLSRMGESASSRDSDYGGRSSKANRLLDAELLGPFGHALTQEWPFITQLITAYFSPEAAACVQHMSSAMHLARGEKQMAKAAALLVRIEAAIDPGQDRRPPQFGSRAWTGLYMYGISKELSQHESEVRFPSAHRQERLLSREALERMQAVAKAVVSQVTASKAAFDADIGQVPFAEAMLVNARAILQNKASQKGVYGSKISFDEAVAQLGERHEEIWLYQENFDESFMQHLARCPEHVSQLLQTEEPPAAADVEWHLALCVASYRGCQLHVAHVPQLSEWGIDEYDGLECVRLM